MSCGFGAVVLIFLIINHDSSEDQQVNNDDMLAEIRMLDYQVQSGEKDLFEMIQALQEIEARVEDSDNQLTSTQESLEQKQESLSELQETSVATTESLNALTADLESREEEVNRLLALKAASEGTQARSFKGTGDRQYLTGLRIGGRNIVVAIDTSASMLDDTIVNVLRRRNMSDAQQLAAPKWAARHSHSRMDCRTITS